VGVKAAPFVQRLEQAHLLAWVLSECGCFKQVIY
jgi:hypothetical protein